MTYQEHPASFGLVESHDEPIPSHLAKSEWWYVRSVWALMLLGCLAFWLCVFAVMRHV